MLSIFQESSALPILPSDIYTVMACSDNEAGEMYVKSVLTRRFRSNASSDSDTCCALSEQLFAAENFHYFSAATDDFTHSRRRFLPGSHLPRRCWSLTIGWNRWIWNPRRDSQMGSTSHAGLIGHHQLPALLIAPRRCAEIEMRSGLLSSLQIDGKRKPS